MTTYSLIDGPMVRTFKHCYKRPPGHINNDHQGISLQQKITLMKSFKIDSLLVMILYDRRPFFVLVSRLTEIFPDQPCEGPNPVGGCGLPVVVAGAGSMFHAPCYLLIGPGVVIHPCLGPVKQHT